MGLNKILIKFLIGFANRRDFSLGMELGLWPFLLLWGAFHVDLAHGLEVAQTFADTDLPSPTYNLAEYFSPFDAESKEFHRVKLVRDAAAKFETQLRLIESAQKYLDVELTSLGVDQISRTLLVSLLKKANSMTRIYFRDNQNNYRWALRNPKNGEKFVIRILVNSTNVIVDPFVIQLLRDAGIIVRYFNPKHNFRVALSNRKQFERYKGLSTLGYITHRSLFISDETIMVSDDDNQYLSFYDLLNAKSKLDQRTLFVEGAISEAAHKSFLQYWGLERPTFDNFYGVDPSSDLGHSNVSESRKFLDVERKDLPFQGKLLEFRNKASERLKDVRNMGTRSVKFLSDLPGTEEERRRVTPDSVLNKGGICVTTLKIPRPRRALLAEVALCFVPQTIKESIISSNTFSFQSALSKDSVFGKMIQELNSVKGAFSLNDSFKKLKAIKPMNSKCVLDPKDPYDPGMEVIVGGLAGKGVCGDTTEMRTPVILPSSDPDILRIANFRYARQWWIATIPLKAISNVYVQTPLFMPIVWPVGAIMKAIDVAHAQLRFKMNPKANLPLSRVQLEPQSGSQVKNSSPIYLDDFIADFQPLDAKDGSGVQTIITRIISVVDRGTESIALNFHLRVEQMELAMSLKDRMHLARLSIERGEREGYKNEYSGLNKNCAVLLLETFDEAFQPPPDAPGVKVRLSTFTNPVVHALRKAMQARGFLNENNSNFTMNDEVGDGGISFVEALKTDELDEKERANFLQRMILVKPPRLQGGGQ